MTLKAHSPFPHLKAPVALISDNDDTYVNTSAALLNVSLFLSPSLSLPLHVTHPLYFFFFFQAHNLPPSSPLGCRAEWRCLPLTLRSLCAQSRHCKDSSTLLSRDENRSRSGSRHQQNAPLKTNTWSNLALNQVKCRRKAGS